MRWHALLPSQKRHRSAVQRETFNMIRTKHLRGWRAWAHGSRPMTPAAAQARPQRHRRPVLCLLGLLSAMALMPWLERDQVWAADGMIAGSERVGIALDQSRVIRLRSTVSRVSVANPEIADILVLDPRQLYAVGKRLGTTNIVLWSADDRVAGTITLDVTPDLEQLKVRLHQAMPGERVEVRAAQGAIIVGGQVSSAEKAEAAIQLAEGYARGAGDESAPARVLNLLQVGGSQQVMLEVKVAEIARSVVKRLDVDFTGFYNGGSVQIGAVGSGARFPDYINPDGLRVPQLFSESMWGPAVPEFVPGRPGIQDKGLFAQSLAGNFLFNLVIDAAKNKGLAKILAEPNLTTLSGQQAKFLAGGEFPIPVPQDLGQTTIEFKDFGVGLVFIPVVLDSGVISLKVSVSVSELATQNALTLPTQAQGGTFFIPALTKRSANATVEVRTGETIAIAGLINEQLRENVDKFPGLGDLPMLGVLFRSQEFVKGQTELVIFVTPRLARSYDPELVKLPTDSFVEPIDQEFYLMGRLQGRPPGQRPGTAAGGRFGPDRTGAEGPFGHDL